MALDTGARRARQLVESGQIAAAAMHLQGTTRTVGTLLPSPVPSFSFEMQGACHV
jgi:hypothetical protein